MDRLNNEQSNLFTILKKICGEFFAVFLLGQVWNKIAFSILLLVIGGVLLFSSTLIEVDGREVEKPSSFNLSGGLLIAASICLITWRWIELNRKSRRQE